MVTASGDVLVTEVVKSTSVPGSSTESALADFVTTMVGSASRIETAASAVSVTVLASLSASVKATSSSTLSPAFPATRRVKVQS